MNLFQIKSQSKLLVLLLCLASFFVLPDQAHAQRKDRGKRQSVNKSAVKNKSALKGRTKRSAIRQDRSRGKSALKSRSNRFNYQKKRHRISHLPRGFKKLRYRNNNYFHRRGVFYRKVSNNFVFVRAPFGYRFKHLPIGFSLIYVSGHPYYYYYGNYYRYDPIYDNYVVCEKPVDEDDDFDHISGLDEIQMTNGTIYHGRYLGGDEESVRIDINGEVKKISLKDIISIKYAAPSDLED